MSIEENVASSTGINCPLPEPRGPLSAAVIEMLRHSPPTHALPTTEATHADPLGDDLALALHACYELHYRGFQGVDETWEWEPGLLALRSVMERSFLDAVRSAVSGGDDLDEAIAPLLVEPVPGHGLSHFLATDSEWCHLREYVAHRSIYHLKEADPQAWVIPRLQGRAKAALVAVEFDEFGGGRAERLHAHLFAKMMTAIGLSSDYLYYLDDVPAPAVSIVNLMSLLGLHRRWRGALVGQFAFVEITSSPGSRRMVTALERFGASPSTTRFYTEHIEADAVHEQLLRREVIGGLLEDEPSLAADVVFGIQAMELLETKLEEQVMDAWSRGESSLRRALPTHPGPA